MSPGIHLSPPVTKPRFTLPMSSLNVCSHISPQALNQLGRLLSPGFVLHSLPVYRPTYLPIYLHTYLSTCLPACLPMERTQIASGKCITYNRYWKMSSENDQSKQLGNMNTSRKGFQATQKSKTRGLPHLIAQGHVSHQAGQCRMTTAQKNSKERKKKEGSHENTG